MPINFNIRTYHILYPDENIHRRTNSEYIINEIKSSQFWFLKGGSKKLPPFKRWSLSISYTLLFENVWLKSKNKVLSRKCKNKKKFLPKLIWVLLIYYYYYFIYWIVWTKNKIKAYVYSEWEFFLFHKDPMITKQ
jgi:hypothetical protein